MLQRTLWCRLPRALVRLALLGSWGVLLEYSVRYHEVLLEYCSGTVGVLWLYPENIGASFDGRRTIASHLSRTLL